MNIRNQTNENRRELFKTIHEMNPTNLIKICSKKVITLLDSKMSHTWDHLCKLGQRNVSMSPIIFKKKKQNQNPTNSHFFVEAVKQGKDIRYMNFPL